VDTTFQQIGHENPQQVQTQGQGECHPSIRYSCAHPGQYKDTLISTSSPQQES
jgi:hypothetical protein